MVSNYAMVAEGVVFNVCRWDGVSPLNPGEGITLVLIPDGSPAWIGWGYTAAGGFTVPPAGTTD